MDYRALQTEIQAGPCAAACAPLVHTNDGPKVDAFVDDQAIADILNANTKTVGVSITVADVFDVLFESGDWLSIRMAQSDTVNADRAAVAKLAYQMITDAKTHGSGSVNLTMSSTSMLFTQLESVGLLSTAGRSALETRSQKQVPVFGSVVTAADVSRALRGPWGDE